MLLTYSKGYFSNQLEYQYFQVYKTSYFSGYTQLCMESNCLIGGILFPLLCPQPRCSGLEISFCQSTSIYLSLDYSGSVNDKILSAIDEYQEFDPGFGSSFSELELLDDTECS